MQEFEFFYVGGRYQVAETGVGAYAHSGDEPGQVMTGQAYVEVHRAAERRSEYPIVVLQMQMQWYKRTPDGRPGWVSHFLDAGFDVYLLHQVSPLSLPTETVPRTARDVESITTATALHKVWGSARLHTQWPGTGTPGDPAFDQYYAAVHVKWLSEEADATAMEMSRDAAAALLDRIGGPVILFTHSQSGELGWLVADARPGQVRAVLTVDPMGPPFTDAGPRARGPETVKRPYGLARAPLSYEPPVSDPARDLPFITVDLELDDVVPCRLQVEPARQLAHLRDVKVLMITGEASYHSHYDPCTAAYLRQAGVNVRHIRLEDIGIHGNGHMVMVEKNSADVFAVLRQWLQDEGFLAAS